jgi:hypothetical protein
MTAEDDEIRNIKTPTEFDEARNASRPLDLEKEITKLKDKFGVAGLLIILIGIPVVLA